MFTTEPIPNEIWNICMRMSGTFGLVNNLFHMKKHQFDMLEIFNVRISVDDVNLFDTCLCLQS